jgi:hypothetical protein
VVLIRSNNDEGWLPFAFWTARGTIVNDEDRLKTYQGFAEISRKWVSVLDAKAGFISAMSAALVGFVWAGD